MTAVLEEAPPEAEQDAAAERRSPWARLRADLRLARRQVWRARGSSALVMALVALPVAGLTGTAVFWQSHVATPEQETAFELGRMQSWISAVGPADPSRQQDPDQPLNNWVDTTENGDPVHPQGATPTDPLAMIPAGATVFPLREMTLLEVRTASGVGSIMTTTGDVWNPSFEGRYHLLEGTAPTAADEAMVTPGLLDRLGTRIGGTVELTESGRSFTITGTLRRGDQRADDQELYLPASASDLVVGGWERWFVSDWQPDLDQLGLLNRAGFIVYAHDLVVNPPDGGAFRNMQDASQRWALVVVGSIAVVFCGYLVVLLAGASFAVAARRQQRALAVAASVGASRSDVFRIVVLQGTVLGTVGGIVGAGAGIGLAAVALAVTDSGVANSFWGHWGFNVPWGLIVGILVFAVVVGTLAAIAPARSASRGDVLGALRGARRPARLNPRRPLWGLGLAMLGIAATVVGALAIAAFNTVRPVDYSLAPRQLAQWAIVIGPVLFQLGIMLAGHWLLSIAARVLSRLGLAPRLASRDAAANPSRVVPAFAAIGACVFLASFALSATAITGASNSRNYSWFGPLGGVSVSMWSADAVDPDEFAQAARDLVAPDHPVATALVSAPASGPVDPQSGQSTDPGFRVWSVASRYDPAEWPDGYPGLADGAVTVIDPDDLSTVLGVALPDETIAAFRDGTALSLSRWSSFERDGTAQVVEWTAAARDAYWQQPEERTTATEPTRIIDLPARTVTLDRPQDWLQLVLSPAAARSLGMRLVPQTLIAVYSHPADSAMLDRLTAAAQDVRMGDSGQLNVRIESGPDSMAPWLWLIVGATLVLVVGAAAVCLGLARFERRPDDATLAAIGGGRGLRRRVNGWQAAVIVGLGTVTGTIAGLIPMWGIAESSGSFLRFADTPWLWLAVLALGLPTVVTLAAWLVPPRHPDLTRRTAIA